MVVDPQLFLVEVLEQVRSNYKVGDVVDALGTALEAHLAGSEERVSDERLGAN
jgi:hypothetical protein